MAEAHRLGAHVSIEGGIDRAIGGARALGATARADRRNLAVLGGLARGRR